MDANTAAPTPGSLRENQVWGHYDRAEYRYESIIVLGRTFTSLIAGAGAGVNPWSIDGDSVVVGSIRYQVEQDKQGFVVTLVRPPMHGEPEARYERRYIDPPRPPSGPVSGTFIADITGQVA